MTVDYEEYHRLGRTAEFTDVRERVRVRTIAKLLVHWKLSTNSLLDVGAGEGRYLPVWRDHFPDARIIALEYSPTASQRSAERYPFAEHINASGEAIPLGNASVDAIASVEAIEHVESGVKMLEECERVLKPGGWLLLSTPCGNRGSFPWLLARVTGNIRPGSEHGIQLGDFDDPTHLRRYRSRELAELGASLGLTTERTVFNLHGFLWLAGWVEMRVKGKVNIGRRSARVERAFENACDTFALIDWWLLRRLPFGSSMITLMRKA
jgi:SAM-dependent methyltransferase